MTAVTQALEDETSQGQEVPPPETATAFDTAVSEFLAHLQGYRQLALISLVLSAVEGSTGPKEPLPGRHSAKRDGGSPAVNMEHGRPRP